MRIKTHMKGFTLVEVLVALLVLSIGLLGLAGLQAGGLRSNHGAYLRSQAVMLAHDMADRMRSNSVAVIANCYEIPDPDSNCNTTNSGNALAITDRADWLNSLAAELPSGVGLINCAAPPCGNSIRTITVQWDDGRTGLPNTTFQLGLRP